MRVQRTYLVEEPQATVQRRIKPVMKSLGYIRSNNGCFRRGSIAGWFSLSLKDQATRATIEVSTYSDKVSQVRMTIDGMYKYGLRHFWEEELKIQESMIKRELSSGDLIDQLNRATINKNLPSLWFGLLFWIASYLLMLSTRFQHFSSSDVLYWAFAIVIFLPIPGFFLMILLSRHYRESVRE